MENQKHAYLILAHKDDASFRALLEMIDDARNDIYIHMDIKCQPYNPKAIEDTIHAARVYHIERISITWGGSSMIWGELALLKAATRTSKYQYYHLLSGQDLPIKTQEYIHAFFNAHSGKEFVRFNHPDFRYKDRVSVYHLFQNYLGRNASSVLNRSFLLLQKCIGINRNSKVHFYKGSNWFSITDGFARFVVENENWIRKVFRDTLCCDEVFIQTLLMMSPYRDNRYWKPMDNDQHAIMRLIDWNRGGPYVYRMSDKEELFATDMIFCRKFSESVDSEIIQLIKNSFSQ